MSSVHYKLSNLVAVIDSNGMQSDGQSCDVMKTNLVSIWKGFGWDVRIIENGHNVEEIYDAFVTPNQTENPIAIIARTTKGKGISFMENNNEWHHNRLSPAQYKAALAELGEDVV